jgi:hypothetical protein
MFAPRGWLSRSLTREMYRMFQGSEYFDAAWYRRQYLTFFSSWRDPIWHYILRGGVSGLAPSRVFDSTYYLEKNDDVRVAKLNPLFHFLAYGQAERRLPLRSANEMVVSLLPEAAHIRAFVTPSLTHRRVSVLFDSSTPKSHYVDFLSLAAQISLDKGSDLRILHRKMTPPLEEIHRALDGKKSEWLAGLEITPVPTTATYSDIPFYADEITLATSWSSARALTFTAQAELSWALRVPSSGAKADNKVDSPLPGLVVPQGVALELNTDSLREEATFAALAWSSSVPPKVLFASFDASSAQEPWKLGVVAEPYSSPLSFGRGIEALSMWLSRFSGASDDVELCLVGETTAPFSFLEEFQPLVASKGDPVHCLLVLSSGDSSDFQDSSASGIRVIHVSPPLSQDAWSGQVGGERVLNCPADIKSIVSALDEAHSSFLTQGQQR